MQGRREIDIYAYYTNNNGVVTREVRADADYKPAIAKFRITGENYGEVVRKIYAKFPNEIDPNDRVGIDFTSTILGKSYHNRGSIPTLNEQLVTNRCKVFEQTFIDKYNSTQKDVKVQQNGQVKKDTSVEKAKLQNELSSLQKQLKELETKQNQAKPDVQRQISQAVKLLQGYGRSYDVWQDGNGISLLYDGGNIQISELKDKMARALNTYDLTAGRIDSMRTQDGLLVGAAYITAKQTSNADKYASQIQQVKRKIQDVQQQIRKLG